jgi:hypothetical protein
MYRYIDYKPQILTDEGQRVFLAIRDRVQALIRAGTGAFTMEKATEAGKSSDPWLKLACVDRLVELGEIREASGPDAPGQYRVFVPTGQS